MLHSRDQMVFYLDLVVQPHATHEKNDKELDELKATVKAIPRQTVRNGKSDAEVAADHRHHRQPGRTYLCHCLQSEQWK